MGTEEIKIQIIKVRYDNLYGDLIFEDNQGHEGKFITTLVWRNQPVIWKVAKGEEITIDRIYPKQGSQNVLEGNGPIMEDEGVWRGVVKPDASGKELYNVDYTLNGVTFTADPEMNVKDEGDGED